MRLYTSSFWTCGRSPRAVAIARQQPQFFKGATCEKLMPSWGMLQRYKRRVGAAGVAVGNAEFTLEYRRLLSRLDPLKVAEELGEGAILCCWEHDPANPDTPCHRTTVAEWITEQTGIVVTEITCHPDMNLGRPRRRGAQLDLFPPE